MQSETSSSSTPAQAPLEQAVALAPAAYTRPDYYQAELQHIVGPGWQCLAPAGLVREPGDLIAREIAGVPVIIVRGKDGTLNGFYNICAHRAGPLATCDRRGLKILQCGYHGWAYELGGQLKTAPEMKEAECFERDQIRLTPIDVQEWGGMVFARLTGRKTDHSSSGAPDNRSANATGLAATAFSEIFAGIDEIADVAMLNGLQHHTAIVYEVQCNWKVYIDNYLEGYHLPYVHPDLTQVVVYPDYRTELSRWWSLQRTPVPEDSGAYGSGEGLYFFVYPNTMLNIMPGRLQSNRVIPTGLHSCKIEFDFYYAPDAVDRSTDDLRFSDQVQEEDRTICEHVQKGLTSGVYAPGRLSPKRESGVWHWHNLLRADYTGLGLAADPEN